MRIVFLLFLVFVGTRSFSQSSLSQQIHAISKDTGNNFRKFQGSFKKIVLDSIYQSKITIEGTTENILTYSKGNGTYHATIIESVDLETAKKILEEWREKLETILGGTFKSREFSNSEFLQIGGQRFSHGSLTIQIVITLQLSGISLHDIKLTFTLPYKSQGGKGWDF